MKQWILVLALAAGMQAGAQNFSAFSPNGVQQLGVNLTGDGQLLYSLHYKNREAIRPSSLSLRFKEPALVLDRFVVEKVDSSVTDNSWQPVWGEYKTIRNHYRALTLHLKHRDSETRMQVAFRVFNEGLGFRYIFPKQRHLDHFILADELTEFRLSGNHQAHWIPGDYDSNEFVYTKSALSDVDAASGKTVNSIFAKTFFAANAVQTPLMLKSSDGLYINIHEAALLNYPAMNLMVDKAAHVLTAHLVPDVMGNKAYLQAPFATPWRTIIVTSDAREIIPANRMILNLNEPAKLATTHWIKPQKYVGVWWEMHVGTASWDKASGKHGATTANVKRYIDFAAKHGFAGVLVEGWNVGWEDWFGKWKEDVFDFVTPYPDYDIKELSRYAKSKGVKIIMHHETSASVTNYERQMDTAYRFMKKHGMDAVKTGYVGYIIPRGEHHDGQWMVRHYQRVAEKTGGYRIMLDAHEPTRPTGLHRTYPNWLASEAARGNEFNAWSEGNPPAHETILPFTRLMGGPMDYTPGIFEIKMSKYDSSKKEQVHTTLAKQLALYVTMYSPLQMAADLPQNYEQRMDAFQFIKDVAVDWDDTKVLDAEPGERLMIARKAKGKGSWFLGAITNEQGRRLEASLDFLTPGKQYEAILYLDANNAHWQNNPMAYRIEKRTVNSKTVLMLPLAPGGGAAVSIIPK